MGEISLKYEAKSNIPIKDLSKFKENLEKMLEQEGINFTDSKIEDSIYSMLITEVTVIPEESFIFLKLPKLIKKYDPPIKVEIYKKNGDYEIRISQEAKVNIEAHSSLDTASYNGLARIIQSASEE